MTAQLFTISIYGSFPTISGLEQQDGGRMGWYTVRTVYLFGTKSDGTNVFEERMVAFKAGSFEEAFEKADLEASRYAQDLGFTAHDDQEAYEQDGDDRIDGYEVWSQLFEARLSLKEFYTERYGRYGYSPQKTRL